jgi:hypothetical protein
MPNGFKIQLREYVTRRPNGDRDMSGGKDCSDYKVVLIKDTDAESVIQTFSGFDNFWSSHRDAAQVRAEATKVLNDKAKFFGATILKPAKFRPAPPRPAKTKWVKTNA